MLSRTDVIQRIKHGLILDHISKRVLREGLIAAGNVASDKRAEFMESMVGTVSGDHNNGGSESPEVIHMDANRIMSMSDEDRMEVYNKILKSVGINESK